MITLKLRLHLVEAVQPPEDPPEGEYLLDTIDQALNAGLEADLQHVAYLLTLALKQTPPADGEPFAERLASLSRRFVRAARDRLDAESLPFVKRLESWPERTFKWDAPAGSPVLRQLQEKYGVVRTFDMFAISKATFDGIGRIAAFKRLLAA